MKHWYHVVFVVLLVFSAGGTLSAQSNDYLKITRVDLSAFPQVKVYARAFCNGVQQPFTNPLTLRVLDGDTLRQATFQCPQADVPISVGLTLDRSSSVQVAFWYIREAALEFVRLMQDRQSGSDEALVVSFNENIYYDQVMTSNKQDLNNAINAIYPIGNTSVWDALMFTLQEVANSASNHTKAVILFSDGSDNVSLNGLRDAIDYARAVNIPVYSLGLVKYTLPEDLARVKMIADSTGGEFIPINDFEEIEAAYTALSSIIAGGQNDCTLDFLSACADGSWHQLIVEAEACNRTLVDTVWIQVPVDPSLPNLHISMDTAYAYPRELVDVPVIIRNDGNPTAIYGLDFEIWKEPLLQFEEIITQGYLAENFAIAHTDEANAIAIHLAGNYTFAGTDTLLKVRYRTGQITGQDTLVPVSFLSLEKQTDACIRITEGPGYVKIIKRTSLYVDCALDTVRIRWDDDSGKYIPEEFMLTATVRNPAAIPIRNAHTLLQLPAGMELLEGAPLVYLTNTTLASGATEDVAYRIRAVPSDSARSFAFCIDVEADSASVATCCTQLEIEKAQPVLQSWCSLPQSIVWVDSLAAYDPPVFPVTMQVANAGELRAKDLTAWIHVPAGFEVDSTTPVNAFVQPSVLYQSDTGYVTWYIRPLERATSDTLEFCLKTAAGGDTSVCCQRVYISASPIRAKLDCGDTRVIAYNDETQEYNPQHFLVSVNLKNNSGIPMTHARGRITLPEFIQLGDGDYYQKDIASGGVLAPGTESPLIWSLVANGDPVSNESICVEIFADNYSGDTCCIPVDIQNNLVLPNLECSLTGPDTIRFTQTAYDPNPFTVSLTVRNTGTTKAKNVYAALLQGADLSIDSTDQALKRIADSLDVNEEVHSTFSIKVLNRSVQRADTVRISVYADNGGATLCEIVIIIEAVRGPIIALQCFGPDSLVFVDSTGSYSPAPFTLRLVATNIGTADADSVVAEFLAGANFELVTGEKAAKMLTPQTLAPSASGEATWQVNAIPRTVGRVDTIYLQVKVKGNLLEQIVPCPVIMYVPPVREANLQIQCEATAEVTVVDGAYQPNPVTFRLVVNNTGTADAFDVTAVCSFPTRLILTMGNQSQKSVSKLEAESGSTEFTWSYIITPALYGDTVEVCFRVSSRFQNEIQCCAKLYIPPIPQVQGAITTICSAVDTVWGNDTTRLYPNPISISAQVTNTTSVQIDSVLALLVLPNGLSLANGETQKRVLYNIAGQATLPLSWNVDVLSDTSTVAKARHIQIQFFVNGAVQYCERTIIVMPFSTTGSAAYAVECSSPDSVYYIDAQTGLVPSPFPVSITITNTGTDTLYGYTATILGLSQVVLGTGYSPTVKSSESIPPGGKRTVTWMCVPILNSTTNEVAFEFSVHIDPLIDQTCTTYTVIEGVKLQLTLSIPEGNVVGYNSIVHVPVHLTNSGHAAIDAFAFDLGFDSSIVALQGLSRPGTLTAQWNNVTVEPLPVGGVRIAGVDQVPISETGVLLYLIFRGNVDNGGHDRFDVLSSELDLENGVLPDPYAVKLVDGDITSSGSCILPVDASELFILEQNSPNPFNPVTVIMYQIPRSYIDVPTRLEVFDAYGRRVRIFDEGLRSGGTYSIHLDASGLQSGMYFYRLTAGTQTRIRKMIYMK